MRGRPKRGREPGQGRRPSFFSFSRLPVRILLGAAAVVFLSLLSVYLYYYLQYAKIVEHRMRGQIFNNASKIYARPRVLRVGDSAQAHQIINQLRIAGYSEEGEKGESRLGTYRAQGNDLMVHPGPESYHASEGARIRMSDGKIASIAADSNGQSLNSYELEPQLVTALFDSEQRSKRRLISYDDVPKVLVDAVLAIEDRRFFQHSGVNFFRLAEAAWMDFREGSHRQGGSTLTMQISRGFFLTPEKTIRRKLTEMLIAIQLEERFSKKQIFELYANQVYMGQRGSFSITGFGEASRAYFNKDIQNLTLPEAALLAAIIQRPNYLSPYKSPERALERRNLVLEGMFEMGFITREDADRAKAAPLKLAPLNVEASDAPYFVDLVKDNLLAKYSERDLNENAYRIFTTLDPDLQRAAAEAVAEGMKGVDAQVKAMRTRRVKVGSRTETKVLAGPPAQVALVALNPHTGEIVALVGGRSYGWSQLNHALAKRPTGSAFKPFVYAAAINTALTGAQPVLTPATLLDDSPTTFNFGDQIYEPRNYQEKYHGPVTARYALALSLNNATVKLAEMVGYDKVAELARAAGIRSAQATPAVALGAYDATPIDVAGAYTVFANSGVRVSPIMVRSVRDAKGGMIEDIHPERRQVLDARVAYVMTDMLEGVLNFGTAAGVRGRGFSAPAAGKTGTSHDAWFAGYTSNLLCIVWVGYDDYSDLRLSGANTAAPIWAEFMKKAIALPEYSHVSGFPTPSGVVGVKLDKATNLLSTPACPDSYYAAFVAGTEPKETCEHSSSGLRGLIEHLTGLGQKPSPPDPVSNTQPPQQAGQAEEPGKKKKGFFEKVLGVFKDEKKPEPLPAPAAPAPPPQPAAEPKPQR
ncbi:MAG TPA: PBP1A family penicillin-binding protein [Terriglobales bacterium]|nr:PBP1A family penicillin-binding protein [Terriglobales bacterium]